MDTGVAVIVTFFSALSLYLGSPNGAWNRLARPRRGWLAIGGIGAVIALLLWTRTLGLGAGISVMLGTWILALVALPYLAWWLAPSRDNVGRSR